jgi:glycosyltransferase involved in cell wall biosynthesis
MSVFNGAAWLREAIESILAQTFKDFEFIIIDDGSIDESAQIVRSYEDERIVFFCQENQGLASALNKGISLSRSDLIARMDADDISFPKRLETQFRFLQQNPEIIGLGSGAIYTDEQGHEIAPVFMPETYEEILEWLPESPFIHPSVIFRKDSFYRAGQYLPAFSRAQDMVLFNQMAKLGRLHNLKEPLLKYRITRSAASRITEEQKSHLRQIIKRVITNNYVDPEDAEALLKMRSKTTPEQKSFSYYFLLAKLQLWHGQSMAARKNFAAAAIFCDKQKDLLPFRLLSLLPGSVVKMGKQFYDKYKQIKNRKNLLSKGQL